jgi:hypothetical protein
MKEQFRKCIARFGKQGIPMVLAIVALTAGIAYTAAGSDPLQVASSLFVGQGAGGAFWQGGNLYSAQYDQNLQIDGVSTLVSGGSSPGYHDLARSVQLMGGGYARFVPTTDSSGAYSQFQLQVYDATGAQSGDVVSLQGLPAYCQTSDGGYTPRGRAAAAVGDWDGDGTLDAVFLYAAQSSGTSGGPGNGEMVLMDGTDPSNAAPACAALPTFGTFPAGTPQNEALAPVLRCTAGDPDGDGKDEIIVVSSTATDSSSQPSGCSVYVYDVTAGGSGWTVSLSHRYDNPLGTTPVNDACDIAAADPDGDMVKDCIVVVGAPDVTSADSPVYGAYVVSVHMAVKASGDLGFLPFAPTRNSNDSNAAKYPRAGTAIRSKGGYTAWLRCGAGDLDGDGKDEIFWTGSNTDFNPLTMLPACPEYWAAVAWGLEKNASSSAYSATFDSYAGGDVNGIAWLKGTMPSGDVQVGHFAAQYGSTREQIAGGFNDYETEDSYDGGFGGLDGSTYCFLQWAPNSADSGLTMASEIDRSVEPASLNAPVTLVEGSHGGSLILGTPTHLQMDAFTFPIFTMQDVPKHVDYVSDLNGGPGIFQGYDDGSSASFSSSSGSGTKATDRSCADSDSSFAKSVDVGGDLDLECFQISDSIGYAVRNATKTAADSEDSQYQSVTYSETLETKLDDVVEYYLQPMDVWRYPILNHKGPDGETLYYQFVIPTPVQPMEAAGKDLDWYQPVHQNGNLLTYPGDPSLLGDYDPSNLLTKVNWFGMDSSSAAETADWDSESEQEQTQTTERTCDSDVDASISLKVGCQYGGVDAKAGISYSQGQNFSDSVIGTNTIQGSHAFDVTLDFGHTYGTYSVAPLMYTTATNHIPKGAFAVDLLGGSGSDWWRGNYGGEPDPALSLPHMWQLDSGTNGETVWSWAKDTAIGARRLRGFFFYGPDGTLMGTSPVATAGNTLQVRIYDLSLVDADDVRIDLTYQPLDPTTLQPTTGSTETLLASADVSLNAWGTTSGDQALPNWSWARFPGLDLSNLTGHYRFYVRIDSGDLVKELPGHDNGDAYDNNWGYEDVYVASGDQTGTADLSLVEGSFAAEKGHIARGEGTILSGRVHNSGNRTVTGIHVLFYEKGTKGEKVLGHRILPGLEPGETYLARCAYRPGDAGRHTIYMKVLPRLGEENTDDNEDSLAVTVGTGSGGSGCDAAGLPWALLLLPPLLLRRRCRA